MSLVKKLAGQTAIYGLSSIVGRLLNYLLTPLYTGVLTKEQYGVSGELFAYTSFGAVLFMYGMETAFFRFIQKTEPKEKVFSTAMVSLIITSLLLAGLIVLFATPLANITRNEGREAYIYCIAFILAADAISTLAFAWLRHHNEALRFAKIRLIGIGVTIGFNLLFYLIFPYLISKGFFAPLNTEGEGTSAYWMFLANVIGSLIVLPFFIKEFQLVRFGFDKILWKEMLIYAFPLIFMGFAGMINETLDRILLKQLIPDKHFAEGELGIYNANYKLSIIITLFIQAFRMGAEPFFFAKAKDTDARQTYAKVMQYFSIVCAVIFVGVMLYLDIFKHFIRRPEYWEGLKIVPILLFANIFLGMYYNLSIWYKLTDKTKLGAWVGMIGAAITLIINFLFIPSYSYMASAWATFTCYLSMLVISYVLGQKYYPVPYPIKRIFAYLLLSFSTYLVSDMLKETFNFSQPVFLLVNTVLFGVFLFVLYKMEWKGLKTDILDK